MTFRRSLCGSRGGGDGGGSGGGGGGGQFLTTRDRCRVAGGAGGVPLLTGRQEDTHVTDHVSVIVPSIQ